MERDVAVVQASGRSLISQRDTPRGVAMSDVVRAALREDPDVLVLDDIRSADVLTLALEAAAPGRLVIAACVARSAPAAVDRLIDLAPPSARPGVQLALANALRGVVAQVLVKRIGGGRVAARELLVNTPAVASLLAEGRTSALHAMMASRDAGMVPMNDVLAGLVSGGVVEARDACAAAVDPAALRAQLGQRGIDISGLEHLG